MMVLIYGLPGTGKTTLLRGLVKAHAPRHLLFVKDRTGDWLPRAPGWRGRPPDNLVVVNDIAELQERPAEDFPEAGVFVFPFAEPVEVAQLALDKGPAVYVDDEVDILAQRAGWNASPLKEIVHRGRHTLNENGEACEVHLLAACRRPQSIHTDLTDMVDDNVYVFRVRGDRTLSRLENDSMVEGDDLLRVRNLGTGQCFHVASQQFFTVVP